MVKKSIRPIKAELIMVVLKKSIQLTVRQIDRLAAHYQGKLKAGVRPKERARNNLSIFPPLPPGEGWGEGINKSSYFVRILKLVEGHPQCLLVES